MPGVSVGDVWRLYTKPSMKGRLIFRKKTAIRKSEKVMTIMRAFARIKLAKVAKEACKRLAQVDEEWRQRCIYTEKVGTRTVERCRWQCFVTLLREAARIAGITGANYQQYAQKAQAITPSQLVEQLVNAMRGGS